jgi:hypothetical protein
VSTALAIEILEEAEAMGLQFRLVGGKMRALFPADARARMVPVLERLRTNREQIADVLRQRGEIPLMPPGVQLVSWKLRKPPIVIQRWSVVTNPALFAERTLEQLEAALDGKDCLAGHRSVHELLDRLEQVGVVVNLDGKPRVGETSQLH